MKFDRDLRHQKCPIGGERVKGSAAIGAAAQMVAARDETVGPLEPTVRYDTKGQVIEMAKGTDPGSAAQFCRRDIGRIFRVGEAPEYGKVRVDQGVISTEVTPVGGVMESGLGRDGSRHGIEQCLETRYTCMGGLSI